MYFWSNSPERGWPRIRDERIDRYPIWDVPWRPARCSTYYTFNLKINSFVHLKNFFVKLLYYRHKIWPDRSTLAHSKLNRPTHYGRAYVVNVRESVGNLTTDINIASNIFYWTIFVCNRRRLTSFRADASRQICLDSHGPRRGVALVRDCENANLIIRPIVFNAEHAFNKKFCNDWSSFCNVFLPWFRVGLYTY